MRLLHIWDEEKDALRCATYLESNQIECHIEPNDKQKWELWVHDERERKRAVELFKVYQEDPASIQVEAKVSEKTLKKSAIERVIDAEDEARRNTIRLDQALRPTITYAFIIISIVHVFGNYPFGIIILIRSGINIRELLRFPQLGARQQSINIILIRINSSLFVVGQKVVTVVHIGRIIVVFMATVTDNLVCVYQ